MKRGFSIEKHVVAERVLLVFLSVLLYLSLLHFPSIVAGDDLDPSWQQSYGYFLRHPVVFGKQIIFTYGPFGYFATWTYDTQLFWLKWVWEILLKGILLSLILEFVMPFIRFRVLSLIGLVFISLVAGPSEFYYTLIILLSSLHLLLHDAPRYRLVLTALLLAALSLVKFPFFVLALGSMGIVEGTLSSRRRTVPGLTICLFCGCYLLLWVVAGQSLSSLPEYLRTALWITSGYTDGMSTEGSLLETGIGAVSLLTLLLLMSLLLTEKPGLEKRFLAPVALLFGFVLLLTWKSGFSRQDTYHTFPFFQLVLSICLFSACLSFETLSRRGRITLLICTLLSVYVLTQGTLSAWRVIPGAARLTAIRLVTNVEFLCLPGKQIRFLENLKHQKAGEWALPRLKAIAGNRTVDVLTFQQGVLLLNEMNWHPRPVFQSYAAYTTPLELRNVNFFLSADAPEFLLMKRMSIDRHFPSIDDGSVLIEVLEHYYPVAAEHGFLLLKRATEVKTHPPGYTSEPIVSRQFHFGEWVPVGGGSDPNNSLAIAQVHFKKTWFGKLRSAVYGTAGIAMNVKFATGKSLPRGFPPRLGESDFVLSPLFVAEEEFLNLYGEPSANKSIVSFQMSDEDAVRTWYQNEITFSLRRVHQFTCKHLTPLQIKHITDELKKP